MCNRESIFFIPTECRGIGDHLQFTRLPEFYFEKFGVPFKVFVDDKYEIWKNIPHVEICEGSPPESSVELINLWKTPPGPPGSPVFRQLAKFFRDVPSNIKPTLGYLPKDGRGPEKKIFICTEGSKRQQANWCRIIPEKIANRILGNIGTLYQIGSEANYKINGAVDLRGASIKETFEYLGGADAFIGVNSGLMHLANCIPWVKVFVYVECDVSLPISFNNVYTHPTNEWLYDDNVFFGNKTYENVVGPSTAIKQLRSL